MDTSSVAVCICLQSLLYVLVTSFRVRMWPAKTNLKRSHCSSLPNCLPVPLVIHNCGKLSGSCIMCRPTTPSTMFSGPFRFMHTSPYSKDSMYEVSGVTHKHVEPLTTLKKRNSVQNLGTQLHMSIFRHSPLAQQGWLGQRSSTFAGCWHEAYDGYVGWPDGRHQRSVLDLEDAVMAQYT